MGTRAILSALSGKLEYKCEDVKRLGYCEQKEGILGYHSDNDIEDLSDDDEVVGIITIFFHLELFFIRNLILKYTMSLVVILWGASKLRLNR